MKKPFSLSPELPLPWGLGLWFSVHLIIPLFLLLSIFFIGKVRINTALFDILPRSGQSRAVMEADMILGEKSSRELVILSAAPEFEKAKQGASRLYSHFFESTGSEHSPDFEKGSLYFDSGVMAELSRYLYKYRFVIAGKKTLALLGSGKAGEIAQDALASAFGAFNLIPLDTIGSDPFLLAGRRMNELLSSSLLAGGSLSLKEDVLSAQKDGTWYVLLRLTLAPHAASLNPDQNAVKKIYAAASGIKDSIPGLEFYFSGVPFHSYESSQGAQKEISLISTITLIILLVIFLVTFRSPLPVILSIMAVIISMGMATAAALLVFREIHIITFVFGTTLIGTCVDYSVHFFVHWKGNPALKDGSQIRAHISKSITMCFISTEICFFVFLFAPFPILKQFAVFFMAGLLSSFLTAFCIFPRLPVPAEDKRRFRFFENKFFLWTKNLFIHMSIHIPIHMRLPLAAGIIVVTLMILVSNSPLLKIENKLSSLYTMPPFLLESESRAARILNHGSPGWYFIVSGASPEETLENEERLNLRLEEEIARGNLGSYLGTSVFVPSIKTQKTTYGAMASLLSLAPEQFKQLGFPPEYALSYKKEFAAAERYCLPKDAPSQFGISNLWIGEYGGNYYSCVLPLNPKDEAVFRSIAGEFDSVFFINKAKDIGRDLDTLTGIMLIFFLAAYIVVSILICLVYPWRDSLKICALPLASALVALAAVALSKITPGFFFAAALILVFGLGLDYILYMTGRKHEKEKSLTLLAVLLSFLTTLLSFGALAFSSFMPVHIFGLTVSAGLSAAFIFALLLQNRED